MHVGLMAALEQELAPVLHEMRQIGQITTLARRAFHHGALHGCTLTAVLSGVGKVSAATTATLLVEHFKVDAIVFVGVAGGLGQGVRVGDMVIATELLQHDLDARPLFPRFEVPLTGISRFETNATLNQIAAQAATSWLSGGASLHQGLIISGDQFIADAAACQQLQALLPDALAVEMEGAAVAQVCSDFGVPVAVIRTISDSANDTATVDFLEFINTVAAEHAAGVLPAMLVALDEPKDAVASDKQSQIDP